MRHGGRGLFDRDGPCAKSDVRPGTAPQRIRATEMEARNRRTSRNGGISEKLRASHARDQETGRFTLSAATCCRRRSRPRSAACIRNRRWPDCRLPSIRACFSKIGPVERFRRSCRRVRTLVNQRFGNGSAASSNSNGAAHLLVKPRLRSLVTFNTMNLTKPVYIGRFDCIFCMDVSAAPLAHAASRAHGASASLSRTRRIPVPEPDRKTLCSESELPFRNLRRIHVPSQTAGRQRSLRTISRHRQNETRVLGEFQSRSLRFSSCGPLMASIKALQLTRTKIPSSATP